MKNRVLLLHTAAALGASANYTSPVEDAQHYRRLVGAVSADQAGTLNIDHSVDGANFVSESIAVAAGTPQVFDRVLVGRHVRVRYVNGAVAQGAFRLFASADAI